MNTRIMYMRSVIGQAIGCLAIQFNKSEGKVSYQFSTLNPKDAFNRTIARNISVGRLQKHPITLDVHTTSMHDISVAVMQHIVDSGTAPNRTVKAAKHWLDKNSYRDV